jgi:hypothetical protein
VIISVFISVAGFLAVVWPELPLGSQLSTPQGPVQMFIRHLIPFVVLFYLPLTIGYFTTRFIRRRCSHGVSTI